MTPRLKFRSRSRKRIAAGCPRCTAPVFILHRRHHSERDFYNFCLVYPEMRLSSTKILDNPTKSIFDCPNPQKRLEVPTKFLLMQNLPLRPPPNNGHPLNSSNFLRSRKKCIGSYRTATSQYIPVDHTNFKGRSSNNIFSRLT